MTPKCFVIAVCNRKGGSAKSTTAVNLAAEYAARGRRTLLVDLDTQGHAGLGVGLVPERGAATAHRIFLDPDFSLVDAVQGTRLPNLWLAPADDMFESTHGGDARALARNLAGEGISDRFDLVVIDTPPSLDLTLLSALEAAHGVVVPLLLHALSLEGVKQLVRLLWKVSASSGGRAPKVGLLPVMVNRRVKLQQTVLDAVISQYGADKLFSGIRTDIALAEAFLRRLPVRDIAPHSRGALDYQKLAYEISSAWRWDAAYGRVQIVSDQDGADNE